MLASSILVPGLLGLVALAGAPAFALERDADVQERAGGRVLRDPSGTAGMAPAESPYGVLAATGEEPGAAPAAEGEVEAKPARKSKRRSPAAAASEKPQAEGEAPTDAVAAEPATGERSDLTADEPEARPKKKKKRRSSWWPFGRKDRDEEPRDKGDRKKRTKDATGEEPIEAGEDAATSIPPVEIPKGATEGLEAESTEKPGSAERAATREREKPAGADLDAEATGRRRKEMEESLPAEITERARRGETRIKDLLERASAIKNRQAEREEEALEEQRREEQARRENELEAARLRELAAQGKLHDEAAGEAALEGGAGGASKKSAGRSLKQRIKELELKRQELLAEGAPQDRIDRIDAQIESARSAARAPKAPKGTKTRADKARSAKAKGTKAPRTAKAGSSKELKSSSRRSKEKAASAPTDDVGAPPLPPEAAPEPAPPVGASSAAPPAEETPVKQTPRTGKKRRRLPAADPTVDAPAIPEEGKEFKLDTGSPTSPVVGASPGLN
jgi:hypothetical protein